jgi:nickel-dependent lactate racemase
MGSIVVALCALAASSTSHADTTGEPSVANIQAAYEREAAREAARHDKDLEVLSADCSRAASSPQFLCWVTYASKNHSPRQLNYDVVTMERKGDEWELQGGLCKR